MEDISEEMRELTKLFIKVLMSMGLPDTTIMVITEMFWNKVEMMDEMVAFIKTNPNATETQVITKAMEISGIS